jgi:hypothetical protein
MHGLGISRRIQQIGGGTFFVEPGSLFRALDRCGHAFTEQGSRAFAAHEEYDRGEGLRMGFLYIGLHFETVNLEFFASRVLITLR